MTLAEQQAELVRALVAGADIPAGFATERVAAARRALLAKRCGEVSRHWPALFADPDVRAAFLVWAAQRPKATTVDDGRVFVREWAAHHDLSPAAADELRRARRRRRLLRWRVRT